MKPESLRRWLCYWTIVGLVTIGIRASLEVELPPVANPPAAAHVHQIATPDPLDAWLEMDAEVLARIAAGEDPWAPEAVVWVVLNRAGCAIGPDGYACERPLLDVVLERRQFGTMRGDRFISAWRPRRPVPGHAHEAAFRALLGHTPDPTGGATHFHRAGTWTPPWAPDPRQWRRFGRHFFYQVA